MFGIDAPPSSSGNGVDGPLLSAIGVVVDPSSNTVEPAT